MYSLRASTGTRRSTRFSVNDQKADNGENVDTINKPAATPKRRGRPPKLRTVSSSSSSEEPALSECSPPKQRKSSIQKTDPAKDINSSKRLMAKLSLSEDSEVSAKSEEKLHDAVQNKYQNARQVLNSAATDNMPGREREYKELHDMLEECSSSKKSASVYISGQPGTGKTATLTKLLQSDVVKKFSTVYVNCTGIASIGSIYKKICEALQLKVKGNKTEKECLATIERYFGGSKQKSVLLILDEIDQLMDKKQTILYTIFEWPAKFTSKLMLVSIANALDFTDRMLSRLHVVGGLKPRLMHFQPYTKQQICDIFNDRLKTAGVLNIFPAITIQLLAAKVAAVSGDVRRALDIGRRVIEIAEQQDKNGARANLFEELGISPLEEPAVKPVEVKQVVSVLNNVYGASQALNEDIDDAYPLQQKITICALLLIMKNEKNKDVSLGKLHDVYRRICVKRNLPAVDQMEFVGMCELIETRGIVKIVKKKEPRLSKIRLQWDEDEVRTALRDKQLIASVLSDSAPLGPR